MADTTALKPLVEVLGLAAAYLESRGSASPRLDAELLLGRVLGLSRLELYLHHDRPLEPAELDRFRELIRRRATGEPVAYLLGERAFRRLVLRSDARALVPRPETETLVEVAIAALPPGGTLLALGTGTGNVALAIADERPDAVVVAVDASEEALALARANVEAVAPGRVELLRSDLYEALPPGARYDVVAGNLPYIRVGDPDLAPDVAAHEPDLALYGGQDGLELLRRAVEGAPGRLAAGGTLALEVGEHQAAAVAALMHEAGLVDVRTARDLAGIERVVAGRLVPEQP
jgi:release factor glutamine methyltransferase